MNKQTSNILTLYNNLMQQSEIGNIVAKHFRLVQKLGEGAFGQIFLGVNDKNKTYFVYCHSGNRSGNACNLMSEMGFEHLYNLSGGLTKWTF